MDAFLQISSIVVSDIDLKFGCVCVCMYVCMYGCVYVCLYMMYRRLLLAEERRV